MPGQGKGHGKGRQRKFSESDDGKDQISYEVYESAANTYFNNRDYRKAIDSYTKALELRPGEVSCLIARSKCNQELGNLDKALKDADDTLKAEPNHVKGILQKGEVLYSQGDFETSLVFFHRGKKIRQEIREFTLGIQKSTSAIENAVGPQSGVQLQNRGDLSYFYEAQQQKQGKKKGYNKPGSRKEERKRDQRPQSLKQDSKTIKQLLGELYADREYLDNLLTDIDDNGAKTQTNEDIRELAISGLRYLNSRSEFWQQQKPMYSRKRDKEMREGARSRCSSAGGSKKDHTQWVLNKLEEVDDAQAKGDHQKSLKMSRKVLKVVEGWSDRDIQNRAEVIANLHSCMGNAHLEMGEYKKALDAHNKDLEIAKQYDIEDAKSRALDNLGRVYARMGQFDNAVKVWEDKLPLAKSALERTWLYHEIGRCYLEIGEYETSLDYGQKSFTAAEEAEDDVWQLNATVLIAQAQVKCGDYQEALDSFEKALDMARLQNDKQAESAIKKALEDVNKKIVKGIKEDDTPWVIKVHTSDITGAGTDANVYIIIKGQTADGDTIKSGKIALDNKGNNFESGNCDEFEIDTMDFDEIESVRVGHDNGGVCSGWHLEKVELLNKSSNKSFKFNCGKWLDDDKDDKATERELTKDGVKEKKNKDFIDWTVKIHTTDMNNSGTNANVYLMMYGPTQGDQSVQSAKINLDNSGNNFESGKCDKFTIQTLNFKQVRKIVIGHDNDGMFAGWHLEKVELVSSKTKKTYVFHCNQWLADDEEDNKIERELFEGVQQKKPDEGKRSKSPGGSSHGSGRHSPRGKGKDKKDDKKQDNKDDGKRKRSKSPGGSSHGSGRHSPRGKGKDNKDDKKHDNKDDKKHDNKDDKKHDNKGDTKRSKSPGGSSHGSAKGKDKKEEKKEDKKEDKKDDTKSKWTIRVYTTDMYGAGTNANVYLTMFGKTKDDNTAKFDKINLDNKGDNFESGNVDEFEVDSLDFEKVEKVRIGRDKSGMIAGWHLDKVELESKSSNKTYTFQCDRWLADDEDDNAVERELTKEGIQKKSQDPVQWNVKVYTTDESGSGTKANVYITLFGKFEGKDDVQSDKINLDNKGNNFETGNCDDFDIETKDYDKVTKIRIGHDNSGLESSWHLNKVELKTTSGRKYIFKCDQWLADDAERERDLTAEKDEKRNAGKK